MRMEKHMKKVYFIASVLFLVLGVLVGNLKPVMAAKVGKSKTTISTVTDNSSSTVKLSKKATKTYSKVVSNVTRTNSKTSYTSYSKTVVKTTTNTKKVNCYTKGKATVKRKTTIKITTRKTVTGYSGCKLSATDAKRVGSKVSNAFSKCGMSITLDPTVTSYVGHMDIGKKSITLAYYDSSIYHEIGHFVAWLCGNKDKTSEFNKIYKAEKGKTYVFNKTYATKNTSEYFAECYKEYLLNPAKLKRYQPKTYNYISKCLSGLTSAQINKRATQMKYLR